jgi:hypothetical protein
VTGNLYDVFAGIGMRGAEEGYDALVKDFAVTIDGAEGGYVGFCDGEIASYLAMTGRGRGRGR